MAGPARNAADFAPNAGAYAGSRRGVFVSVAGTFGLAVARARADGAFVVVDSPPSGTAWAVTPGDYGDLRFVFVGGRVTSNGTVILGDVDAHPFVQVFEGAGTLQLRRGDLHFPWLGAPFDGAGDCSALHRKAEAGVAPTGVLVLPAGGRFRYATAVAPAMPFRLEGEAVIDGTIMTLNAHALLGPRGRTTPLSGGAVVETSAGRVIAADAAAEDDERIDALNAAVAALQAEGAAARTTVAGFDVEIDRLTGETTAQTTLLAGLRADLEALAARVTTLEGAP